MAMTLLLLAVSWGPQHWLSAFTCSAPAEQPVLWQESPSRVHTGSGIYSVVLIYHIPLGWYLQEFLFWHLQDGVLLEWSSVWVQGVVKSSEKTLFLLGGFKDTLKLSNNTPKQLLLVSLVCLRSFILPGHVAQNCIHQCIYFFLLCIVFFSGSVSLSLNCKFKLKHLFASVPLE